MNEIDQIKRQFKEIKHLKAENEELREMNYGLSEKFANVCGGCFEQKLREKYEQCLNEIKHILEVNKRELDECLYNDIDGQILQKIKQAKEGK